MRSSFLLREHGIVNTANPVRQTTRLTASSGTTVGGTLSKVPLQNSMIAVEVYANTAVTVSSISGVGVSNWSQAANSNPPNGLLVTYYGVVSTTPTANLTVTLSGAISSAVCNVIEMVGVGALDTFNVSSGSSNTPTIPTLGLAGTGEVVVSQSWIPGQITRATSSVFPVTAQGNGTLSVGPVTTGAAGDMVILTVAIASSTITVSSASLVGYGGMYLMGRYFDSILGVDFEMWAANISSVGTVTATITPSASLVGTYVELSLDEFTAGFGAATAWSGGAPVGLHSTSSLLFPNLNSYSSGAQMYLGYAYPSVSAAGGNNPVNSKTFAYNLTGGSHQSLIAFNGSLDASQLYQPSGSTTGGTPTITKVGSFVSQDTNKTAQSFTSTEVGDLLVLTIRSNDATASRTINSVATSGTGTTSAWQRAGSPYTSNNGSSFWAYETWYAVVLTTGATTATWTWSATPSQTVDTVISELNSGLSLTQWSVVAGQSGTGGSSATITFPTLSSTGVGAQAYIGYADYAAGTISGSSAGFTRATTALGNAYIYDLALTPNTPYTPNITSTASGTFLTTGVIFSAAPAASTGSVGIVLVANGPIVRSVINNGFVDSFNPVGQNPGAFQSYKTLGGAVSYTAEQYNTNLPTPWYSQATAFKPRASVTQTSILVIVMENETANQVYGNSLCPNLTSLANNYAHLTASYGISHPSLQNYLGLAFGQVFSNTNADNEPSGQAGTALNIGSQCDAAGLVWGGYFQNVTSNFQDGGGTDAYGNYYYQAHHNPFIYNTSYNAARLKSDASLISDLNSANPPRFAMLVPNMINDQHDGPLSTGDTYIGNLVSQIQATPWYQNGGVIFITYDESNGNTPDTGIGDYNPGGGNILSIAISSALSGYGTYSTPVNHVGVLGSIERVLGLTPLANAAHSSNGNIDALLTPTPPPTTILTSSLPGGQVGAAYSTTLVASGGQAPYTWTAAPLPAGLSLSGATIAGTPTTSGTTPVLITVKDSSSPQQTKSTTLSLVVSPSGSSSMWSVDTSGQLDQPTATTTMQFPSLTPASTPELYVGYGLAGIAATGGTPPAGFTYQITGGSDMLIYDQNITTAPTPTATQTSAFYVTLAALFKCVVSGSPIAPFPIGTVASTAGAGVTSTSFTSHAVNNLIVLGITAQSPATVASVSGGGVATWSKIRSLSDAGGYEAELWWGVVTTPGTSNITITLSSGSGTTWAEVAAQEFSPTSPPLAVATGALPSGSVGSAYNFTLQATGGKSPYTWTASPLPAGLSCSSAGIISGTPTTTGTTSVVVTATDSTTPTPQTNNVTLSLVINPAGSKTFGGILGIYVQNGNTPTNANSILQSHGAPSGYQIPTLMYFGDGSTISSIEGNATAGASTATSYGMRLVSAFNLAASGDNLASTVAGAYDTCASVFANNLINKGQSNAIIRMGWEMNLLASPWLMSQAGGPSQNTPTSYVAAVQRIVNIMKAVPNQNFLFCSFNPALNLNSDGGLVNACYPGDPYTDIIGIDMYDQVIGAYPAASTAWSEYVNAPIGLTWMANMATAHSKYTGFFEWGLGYNGGGTTGGDNAYFVNQTAAWCMANNAYICTAWSDNTYSPELLHLSENAPLSDAAIATNLTLA